eukprot:492137-Pelagomonas_calceolata.AAC.8
MPPNMAAMGLSSPEAQWASVRSTLSVSSPARTDSGMVSLMPCSSNGTGANSSHEGCRLQQRKGSLAEGALPVLSYRGKQNMAFLFGHAVSPWRAAAGDLHPQRWLGVEHGPSQPACTLQEDSGRLTAGRLTNSIAGCLVFYLGLACHVLPRYGQLPSPALQSFLDGMLCLYPSFHKAHASMAIIPHAREQASKWGCLTSKAFRASMPTWMRGGRSNLAKSRSRNSPGSGTAASNVLNLQPEWSAAHHFYLNIGKRRTTSKTVQRHHS